MNRPTYDLKSIQKDLVLIAGTFTTDGNGAVTAYEDHGKPVSGIAKTATGLYKVSLGITGRKAEAKLAELLFASAVRVNAAGQQSSDALDVYASGVTSATDPYVTFQNVSRQNIVWQEFANPDVADVDAVYGNPTPITSAASPLTITSGWSTIKAALFALFPRNVTITVAGSGTPTDAHASCVVTGTDINDAALTETISGLNAGAATYAGVKCFKTITSLAFTAGAGTGATMTVGSGAAFALSSKAKVRQSVVVPIFQAANTTTGTLAIVTNGTFVIPATSPPNGSWTPNTAPDGENDYIIAYEPDTAVQVVKDLISSTVQFCIIARAK